MRYFRLVDQQTDTEQIKIRQYGFDKLEELRSSGKDTPIGLFAECLAHPYQFIRIQALETVSDLRKEEFIWLLAMALNDESDSVVQEAAFALEKLNSDRALEILSNAFFQDSIERPLHIANAIAQFQTRGLKVLIKAAESSSPNIRYYAARGLGATGPEDARKTLEKLAGDDEKTSFCGMVSTAARKGLKTLSRIQDRERRK